MHRTVRAEMKIMMITFLLLGILFLGELFFLLWNLKAKHDVEETSHSPLHNREKMIFRAVLAALLILCLLFGVLKGLTRYGFLLAVLFLQAAGTFAFLLLHQKNFPEKPCKLFGLIGKFFGNIILYTIALLPAVLFPQYQEPKVTGAHEVATETYTWVDENRRETYTDTGENRAVTVKFWYPEEDGSYPLVVFSHGAFGVIDSNYSTCMELASHGYVVASIAHPYHALFVENVNGNLTFVNPEFFNQTMHVNDSDDSAHEKAAYEMSREWLLVRSGDENFVLDTILEKTEKKESGPFGKVNPDKIGLFGHSLGGATSVMVGRQRNDIDAVIDLEGTMLSEFTGYENEHYIFNKEPYPVPLLDVNSRAVYEEIRSYENIRYVNFYIGENAVDFREVLFNDAAHMNFTDLPLVSPLLARMLGVGKVDAKTCIENVNEMVLNYFDYYLKDAPKLALKDVY